ncbi:MAG: hypothetical protein ABIP78_13670 [Pyrinomonadaceae bacterium]
MLKITRKTLLSTFLTVMSAVSFVTGQDTVPVLNPHQTVTFSLEPSQEQTYTIKLRENGFAEINWLVSDGVVLSVEIFDPLSKKLESISSDDWNGESLLFVAPKEGAYRLVVQYRKESETKNKQNISIEFNDKFNLPPKAKLKDSRTINGFNIKIMSTSDANYVLFEKNGVLKRIMESDGGLADYIGFSFPDRLEAKMTAQARQKAALLRNTLDKSGDGIPDVMIDYYSDGTHCCYQNYFINLGETVEQIESINTGHVGMWPFGKNPKGGLFFETADNTWAYWPDAFVSSAFPTVILEFRGNKLTPAFDQMKRSAPSLAVLRKKAEVAGNQISLFPYYGEDDENHGTQSLFQENVNDFSNTFYSEMLDLIYSGNEALAWQFFDLVWPRNKSGKELFRRDFNKRLSESNYWQTILKDGKGK